MASLGHNESDEDDDIALSTLQEQFKTTDTCNLDDEDDIPLNILAKTLEKSNSTKSGTPRQTDSTYSRHTHMQDHSDYFRKIGQESGEGGGGSTDECVSQDLMNILVDGGINDGLNNTQEESPMFECDGLFNLDETNIIGNEILNNEYEDQDLNVLMPLFEEVITSNVEANETSEIHIVFDNDSFNELENEIPNSECLFDDSLNKDADSTDDTEYLQTDDTDICTSQTESENEHTSSKRSRRRQKNPEEWKQNMRKRKRNAGEEYLSCRGKKIPRRAIQRPICKCRFKCSEQITENDQNVVFQEYWKLGYGGQRDYIRQHVTKAAKQRSTTQGKSRREHSYQYFLRKDSVRVRVCKMFFLKTLNIGEKTISYTLAKQETVRSTDKRGKKIGNKKISDEDRQYVRDHINSFPAVESHYCRKTTSRKYLEKSLSIRKMYNLYKEKCESEGRNPVKYWLYDDIFGREYNIGFHRPKKDVCTFCDSFEKLSPDEKEKKKDEHNQHLKRKQQAREEKQKDKERSNNHEENVQVLNFDLQKVLITPKMFVSDAYYSRKLSTYNFTIYDLSTRKVQCYVWNESEANRGSCEIATCLFLHNKQAGEVDEMVYYSDSCTGQQRNLPFCMMCLYSVTNLPIQKITHNYFERGHSQMEGDSVHATIENHTKRQEMYSPGDWIEAIKTAKQRSPKYNVCEINNSMIIDFKACVTAAVSNRRRDSNDEVVQWNKIHSFQYRKDSPYTIFFKYELSDEYRSMNINRGRRRMQSLLGYELKTLYKSRISISAAKYADLVNLCNRGLIPSKYHTFYLDLPHDGREDRLPEPNSSDESDACFDE